MRPSELLPHALHVGGEIGVLSLELELANLLARDEMSRNGEVPEMTRAGIERASRDRLAGLSERGTKLEDERSARLLATPSNPCPYSRV